MTNRIRTNLFAITLATFALAPLSGHCFYNPSTGRWINRDPAAELAFHQLGRAKAFHGTTRPESSSGLYLNSKNNCVSYRDYLGLWSSDTPDNPIGCPTKGSLKLCAVTAVGGVGACGYKGELQAESVTGPGRFITTIGEPKEPHWFWAPYSENDPEALGQCRCEKKQAALYELVLVETCSGHVTVLDRYTLKKTPSGLKIDALLSSEMSVSEGGSRRTVIGTIEGTTRVIEEYGDMTKEQCQEISGNNLEEP
jgi:hypothetical protein